MQLGCGPDTDTYWNEVEAGQDRLSGRIISLFGSEAALLLPESTSFEEIPSDPKNRLTSSKIELGQLLFHETALGTLPSKTNGAQTYSCASCHHHKAGFQSGTLQGIGEGGIGFGSKGESRRPSGAYLDSELDVQPIRSPTVLNTAFQKVMLWNGQFGSSGLNAGTESQWKEDTPKEFNFLGFQGVETQAIAGMGVHRLHCEPELIQSNQLYKDLFDRAFPEVPESERYSDLNAALAIAAYERTLLANRAPFQRFLRGDRSALTASQVAGALLFFGKAECFQCHSGPALNSESFHSIGLSDFAGGTVVGPVDESTKKGRGGFTGNPADDFRFKTPTLYNLKGLSFLGHGGSIQSVYDMVAYKNQALAENPEVPRERLSRGFSPLGLSGEEIRQLTDFIENGLYDPDLVRYVPESLPSGNCFPVADPVSRGELGCD